MTINILEDSDNAMWDNYVMRSDLSTCYHLSGWREVIRKSFGHDAYYLYAEDINGIKGILPLFHIKSAFFGNFIVSMPYFNYGGICADNTEIATLLLEKAIEIAHKVKAKHIELRHTSHLADMPEKTAKVSMRLQLTNNPDKLWESFSSKLRSQVRRPDKEGMYAKLGKEEELDSFYKVFSANMRDLGTPVYPKRFFRNILREFTDSTFTCTVYTKDGRPAASGFLAGFKDRLEIPWASSLRKHNHLSPNMLLYWTALQFACKTGYAVFDFGRSTPEEGSYKFKEQWGAKPVQLYWHYWLKNGGQMPELNPKNPKYQAAIKVWRKLPLSATRLIGPPIAKNLP
jgi:FemAB-related protein (PEP-CTERM system-associated)